MTKLFSLRKLIALSCALVACLWGGAGCAALINVSIPNGLVSVTAEDLSVQSRAGAVTWMRAWDGREWKFNPHWESLSQSWRNLTGSQSADTTGSLGGSSSASTECWVLVDEDWTPLKGTAVIDGALEGTPLIAARSTPFNRAMETTGSDYPVARRVSADYATLCAGSAASQIDAEGLRRLNNLYLGENGRLSFNNRAVIEKRSVSGPKPVPAASAASSVVISPVIESIPKGWRWSDRSGTWIDYDTVGRVVAYGDANNNRVWLQRDDQGVLRSVHDANGRLIYSLHYAGDLLVEVRDYPDSSNSLDLLTRSVKYAYDTSNRLSQVTDVRGYISQYTYDAANRLTKVTDPEGRIEQLNYAGDIIKQRIAPDGGVTDYSFDYDDVHKQFVSKVTGPETEAGRRVEDLTHNRAGQLVSQVVNGRSESELRYDTGTRTVISTNARGFTRRRTNNEFDQTTSVVNEDGSSVQFSYAASNLQMTEAIDEIGIKTQYQYDSQGNLLKLIEAAGTADQRITEFQLNSYGQSTQLTRKGRTESNGTITADASMQIEYDALGQISKLTDGEGKARQFTYDRAGNLARSIDPLGQSTRYEADAAGHLTKLTDALGHVSSFTYDKVGNLVNTQDARGKITLTAYDAMNRRLQTTNAVGGIRKLQYNNQGLIVQSTDEDGRIKSSEYNNFLQLAKQSDALGNQTESGYLITDGSASGTLGALDSPTEIKYPSFTLQARYDEQERPTSRTLINPSADGSTTTNSTSSVSYDKRGLIKSETDAYGKTSSYTYDALRQRIESTDSLGNKTTSLYDARGNLIALSDAKGNITRFEYNRNDALVKEIAPLGQTKQYQYDDAGNLQSRIDASGNKNSYQYDAANSLIELKQYRAGTGGALGLVRTTHYNWDANNNLQSWTDVDATRPTGQQTSSTTFIYDDVNRKTGETVSYPNPQGGSTSLGYAYQYSLAGKKTQLTWADGTQIAYSYSAHAELESITIPGEGAISINKFKWIAPTQTTLPGGSTLIQSYDGALQVVESKVKTPGQQTVLSMKNTWGKLFELQSVQRSDTAGGATLSKASNYSYDDELRLIQAQTDTGALFGSTTETFTLDGIANRTAHSKVVGAWQYDANNRLTQRGTGASASTYQYDDNGNLTQKSEGSKITRYAYDTLNRLIEVTDASSGSKLIARYGYDPMSRRLWKEQYRDKDGNALAPAKRVLYLYADEGLIAEATQAIVLNTDGSVTASEAPAITTQYGPKPNSEFGTDTLFVKTRNSNGQDSFAYYAHDHLGTPLQAIDKAGRMVWVADYNAFGEATIITPAATTDSPTISSNLRLPGQYFDEETALHYNWHRYYDPSIGRYISADPIGLAGGLNTYAYVGGNPTSRVDPRGLDPWWRDPSLNPPSGPSPYTGPMEPGLEPVCVECLFVPAARLARTIYRLCRPSSGPGLPSDLVGSSDKSSGMQGNRYNNGPLSPQNGGTGNAQTDFNTLTGGRSSPAPAGSGYPPGTQLGDNNIALRPGSGNSGPRIDIPENGAKPHETLHYPPGRS